MKQETTQYLALDVHHATSVATVRDDHGAIRMRATVPTEAEAVVALVKGIGRPVHVAFEEGTQAQWLHDLLEPHADRVVVCNVRGPSETSNKRGAWSGGSHLRFLRGCKSLGRKGLGRHG